MIVKIRHWLDEHGEVIWNERFAALAFHHGFILKRGMPYRARTKGKVKNGVKYVKQNFWQRVREFQSLHDLNLQARQWMDTLQTSESTERLMKSRLNDGGTKD